MAETGVDAPYEPPESLWQLIKSVANERELDVIKRVIGESLVETTLDLHAEIDTLLEIWRDYRHETLENIAHMRNNRKEGSTTLPEPPNQRETLKKEILFFVGQLRESFKEKDDRFSAKILTNNHNLNVINYVLNSTTTSQVVGNTGPLISRPGSAMNKQTGMETPVVRASRSRSSSVSSTSRSDSRQRIRYRSVSRSAMNSTQMMDRLDTPYTNRINPAFQEELELMVDEDKLNVRDIDDIVENLRKLLEEERDALLQDVEFLYECIDGESEYRAQSRLVLKEPTLNELKEERKRLEADLLSTTGKNQYEIGKLLEGVNRSNVKSPMGRLSPPSSAGSIKSRASSTLSLNQITTTTTDSSRVSQIKKPIVNGGNATSTSRASTKINLNLPSHERSSLTKPRPNLNPSEPPVRKAPSSLANNSTRSTNMVGGESNINSLGSSNNDLKSSRNNSAMSIASSVGSSTESSNYSSPTSNPNHKQTAVQKFRQMVLDHRD